MEESKKSYDFYVKASDSDFQEALLKIASKRGSHLWSNLSISFVNQKIVLVRTFEDNRRESAEIPASGYWESPINVFWGSFYKMFQGTLKDDTITIVYSIKNRFLGLNGMDNFCLAEGPSQFEIQFSSFESDDASSINFESVGDQILKRIQEIDKENSINPPKNISVLAKTYERDKILSKLIKSHRGSFCQICGFSFKTKNNEDYSECHHLEHLAKNGLDVSKNMLVLCPNHHRQAHYGSFEIIEHNHDCVKIKIDGLVHLCQL